MNPQTPNLLNPRVQAIVALLLIAMFGGALFLPVWYPQFKPEPSVLQTLLTLVVVGVTFYLGTSSGSSRKDDQIANTTQQLLATTAPAPLGGPETVKVDDSTPIKVSAVIAPTTKVTPNFSKA